MADFSAAAGGGLNVGTLTINLALNTSDLAKKLDEVNRNTKSMADKLKSEFDKMGGTLGNFGERIGQASKAIEKMFGDKAPAAMQQFGREAQKALGLSDSAVKGLAQSAGAMEGAFKAAGLAVSTLLSPLGAVLAAALGVAAAVGAIRNGFDTLKGASLFGGGGAGRGQEYAANQKWVMDNVPGAARAADYGERLFTWAGNRAGSEWDRAAATPGSVAETVSKANPWQDIKDAFGRVAKDLESALAPVMKMFAPGTSAADRGKAGADAAGHNLKLAEATSKTMAAAEAARWKAMEDAQAKLGEESMRGAQDLANQQEMIRQQELDALAEIQAQDALGYESLKQANADVLTQRIKDEQEMSDRWQALGSGQIGTAAGVGGIGGAMMNIAGGAAAQYEYTGTALQGAAQGGQAGGPWGAVIGAIIALAMQTESFRKLMGGIEEALGNILPLLSELLEPIVASITGALDVLNPILKIITKITDALSSALDPIYNLADSIGDLLGVIGDAVDTINTDVLTDWSKESLGDKNDEWGKYGIQDWLTLTPLINKGMAGWKKLLDGDGKGGDPFANEFTAADGPSALAQELEAKQKAERREAWDLDPRNPYYMQNLNALALAKAEERQREAKEAETREAERAAAALRELADSVTNAVEGYKLEGAMYRASDSITRSPATGNPYA